MEKIGADAIRVRRVVVVRRIAVAVDIEEVCRVVRIHRALPPIVANLRMPTSRHSAGRASRGIQPQGTRIWIQIVLGAVART